jgi:hypothetical protein
MGEHSLDDDRLGVPRQLISIANCRRQIRRSHQDLGFAACTKAAHRSPQTDATNVPYEVLARAQGGLCSEERIMSHC